MAWIADNTGAITTDITFKLATSVIDDGEGGSPGGTTDVVVKVRLVPVQRLADVVGINETLFPGSPNYRYVFTGWVNDPASYTFPDNLRHQGRAEGTCTLQNRVGRIECSISAFPTEDAASMIGEKFTAGWTPD